MEIGELHADGEEEGFVVRRASIYYFFFFGLGVLQWFFCPFFFSFSVTKCDGMGVIKM